MKKLLLAATAVFVLTMLAPVAGFAEPTHPNEVGLYTTPDGYGATGTYIVRAPVDVYLVLTKPTDVQNGGTPINDIYGFEYTLTFDPIPNNDLILLSRVYPPNSVDIYYYSNDINNGYLDSQVGIDSGYPVPVVDEAVVLMTFTFINMHPTLFEVTLGPLSDPNRITIPGQMAFINYGPSSWDAQVMYSVGGSHESPVFIFNGEAVAVENESFGSVKALYR